MKKTTKHCCPTEMNCFHMALTHLLPPSVLQATWRKPHKLNAFADCIFELSDCILSYNKSILLQEYSVHACSLLIQFYCRKAYQKSNFKCKTKIRKVFQETYLIFLQFLYHTSAEHSACNTNWHMAQFSYPSSVTILIFLVRFDQTSFN